MRKLLHFHVRHYILAAGNESASPVSFDPFRVRDFPAAGEKCSQHSPPCICVNTTYTIAKATPFDYYMIISAIVQV